MECRSIQKKVDIIFVLVLFVPKNNLFTVDVSYDMCKYIISELLQKKRITHFSCFVFLMYAGVMQISILSDF